MPRLDIHDFAWEYERAQERVRQSDLSARNKELIFAYRDACLLNEVCGKVRLIRVLIILPLLARRLGKDFDQVTKQDLKGLVTSLLGTQLKPTTQGTYRAILKRFMCFVLRPDEFPHLNTIPSEISWIRSHVRKRDQPRLERHHLLTPKDIDAMIRASDSVRDRALIASLWEKGPRISEEGNLQIKHITKHEYGFTIDMTGKTGHRNVLVISAASHLAQWLAVHPYANDPEAPLWLHSNNPKSARHVEYAGLRAILQRALKHAGIAKRVYPHLFRHSRCTHVLATGIMNEQQAKAYFGWTPDSTVVATYAHLIDQDANDAILRENNLGRPQEKGLQMAPRPCPTCHELNTPTTQYCTRCTTALDSTTAYNTFHRQEQTSAVMLRVIEVLAKKGLLDEAADEVHKAGLGPALKALAAAGQFPAPNDAVPRRIPAP